MARKVKANTSPEITKEIQRDFEKFCEGAQYIPSICGYYGRACRQLENPEGANRNICLGCPLADYAKYMYK